MQKIRVSPGEVRIELNSLEEEVSEEQNLLQKMISLGSALLTGKDVGLERMKKRLEVCSTCKDMRSIKEGMICGLCGCRAKLDDRALINLARYEETNRYGCKAKGGSKWKKAGV